MKSKAAYDSAIELRVLFVVKDIAYFVSHRLDLAKSLRVQGVNVVVATDLGGAAFYADRLSDFRLMNLPFLTIKQRPWQFLGPLLKLASFLFANREIIVFSVTLPASVLTGLFCRIFRIRHVALIAGLGNIFHGKPNLGRRIGQRLLRFSLNKPKTKIIVQNKDIARTLLELHFTSKIFEIPGSGIDETLFEKTFKRPRDPHKIKILFLSRMLREKGVIEFIEAAKAITKQNLDVEFILAGRTDPLNPTSLKLSELEELLKGESRIKWIGHSAHIIEWLYSSDVVCLPSYHEGLPRTLLEGALAGCCLVASDIPGCRAIISSEELGVLVKVRSAADLQEKISHLIDHPTLIDTYGANARAHVLQNFTNRIILPQYIEIILNKWS